MSGREALLMREGSLKSLPRQDEIRAGFFAEDGPSPCSKAFSTVRPWKYMLMGGALAVHTDHANPG